MRRRVFSACLALLLFSGGWVGAKQSTARERAQESTRFDSAAQPSTPVLLVADADCILIVDGEQVANLSKDQTHRFSLLPGEHLLEARSQSGASWKQVVSLEAGRQKVVQIELHALVEQELRRQAEERLREAKMREEQQLEALRAENAADRTGLEADLTAKGMLVLDQYKKLFRSKFQLSGEEKQKLSHPGVPVDPNDLPGNAYPESFYTIWIGSDRETPCRVTAYRFGSSRAWVLKDRCEIDGRQILARGEPVVAGDHWFRDPEKRPFVVEVIPLANGSLASGLQLYAFLPYSFEWRRATGRGTVWDADDKKVHIKAGDLILLSSSLTSVLRRRDWRVVPTDYLGSGGNRTLNFSETFVDFSKEEIDALISGAGMEPSYGWETWDPGHWPDE